MIDAIKRLARGIGTALVVAVVPVSSLTIPAHAQAPAIPGLPDMGEAYPLDPAMVVAWVDSYAAVAELGDVLDEQYDFPEGNDPMAALAGLGVVNEAMEQLNAVVRQYGFDDFQQWTDVMFSVVFAYAVLDAPAEQKPMLLGMFNQTQENLDAVAANYAAVETLLDSL